MIDPLGSQTRQLAVLNAISSSLSNSLEVNQFLNDALKKTLELMEVEAGGIYLLQDDRVSLKICTYQGLDEEFIAGIDNLLVGEGFSGRVVQNRRPLLLDDVASDPRLTRSVVSQRGFHSLAVFPLIARGAPLGTAFLITRRYHHFSRSDLGLLTSIGGQIGIAVENSLLITAVQRRVDQFRVLTQVNQHIASILDANELMVQITRLVQETFGYYHVGIGLIEDDCVVYRVGAGVLWDDPDFQFKPARLRVGEEGFSGWVAGAGEALMVNDVSKDPRYVLLQGSRCRSELLAPIKVKGKLIGVLDVQSDQLNDFDELDLEWMRLLADGAGVAIENARLYDQAKQIAIFEERQRLARELHDSVTQSLYGITLYSQAAAGQLAMGNIEQVKAHIQDIQDTAQEGLAEMRLLIYELRPPMLEHEGLEAALQARLYAVEGRAGLQTNFRTELAGRLTPAIEEGLYRIAQETLNNALKHAHAHAIEVSLRQEAGMVVLEIADDGLGFDRLLALERGGVGLSAMQSRAAELGGYVEIVSGPGSGTRVRVEAPL